MIDNSVSELKKFVKAKNQSWGVTYYDSYFFAPADLASDQAKTFGCDPDFQAHMYGAQREPPKPEDLGTMRAAGGHIHVGYDKDKCKIPDFAMVQLLEAYVYVRYAGSDHQPGRGKFYGLPGLYRPKPYGIEYRTPSNFWVHHRYDIVAEMGLFAKALLADQDNAEKLWNNTNFERVEQTILARGANPEARLVANEASRTMNRMIRDLEILPSKAKKVA